MIKVYKNGEDFILENKSYLDLNKYMATFFYIDAKLLKEATKENYAIRVENNNYKLLAIRVNPYNLCLFGDKECLEELLNYLNSNNYIYDGLMASTEVGDYAIYLDNRFYRMIGMDFMEAKTYKEESSSDVIIPSVSDLDSIYDMSLRFFLDCGLPDRPNKDNILKGLNSFRIIKINNQIVSMGAYSNGPDNSCRITHVYTKPEYRGMGHARKVVNTIKNEILDNKKIPTLNVDQKNPISNHLYKSLGFEKVFSQGIYIKKNS